MIDLESLRIYSNARDLPVGKSLTLPPANSSDDFGGLVIKRNSAKTFVFQREFYRTRSRWADTPADAIREITYYLVTGNLHPSDNLT